MKTHEVLNKMIEDGTINLINEFWGEWHDMKISDPKTLEISKTPFMAITVN